MHQQQFKPQGHKRPDFNTRNPFEGREQPKQFKQINPEEDLKQAKAEDEELTQAKKEDKELKQAKPESSTSGGRLPENVQAKMGNAFGADFSGVNVHTNSSSAKSMGAQAYTQGNDVHFAPGKYNPSSKLGQELIGHELTHVVQQRAGRVKNEPQGKGGNINADPELEKEADVMGMRAASFQMNGENISKTHSNQIQLQQNSENNGTIPYLIKKGEGYWSLARFLMKNSGRPWLVDQEKNNPKLVKELAEAIKNDFHKKDIKLEAGNTVFLNEIGYYIPRLSTNKEKKIAEEIETIEPEKEKLHAKKTPHANDIATTGFIGKSDLNIVKKQIKVLEMTNMKAAKGLVLHRTAGSTASGAMATGKKTTYGTHFYVGKDGTIYQTADLRKWTQHVGKAKKGSVNKNMTSLNTIGIEVVGIYKTDKTWEPLTEEQIKAVSDLVKLLLAEYSLSKSDIYVHEDLSAKTAGEGKTVYDSIIKNL